MTTNINDEIVKNMLCLISQSKFNVVQTKLPAQLEYYVDNDTDRL